MSHLGRPTPCAMSDQKPKKRKLPNWFASALWARCESAIDAKRAPPWGFMKSAYLLVRVLRDQVLRLKRRGRVGEFVFFLLAAGAAEGQLASVEKTSRWQCSVDVFTRATLEYTITLRSGVFGGVFALERIRSHQELFTSLPAPRADSFMIPYGIG